MYQIFISITCLVAILLGAGCLFMDSSPSHRSTPVQTPAPEDLMQQIREQYPAPGELYDVNGYRMHLRCVGEGTPTVIMEAGSGDCSLSWALVQQNVSQFTRVCTYDRQGYGWSDPVAGPVTAQNVTGSLHALLTRANTTPPYVMVGHSLGGIYVRSYAHRYPDDVAGMVLVDPGSEWQMSRTGENFTREMKAAVGARAAVLREMGQEAADGTFARNLSLVEKYADPRLPAWEYRAYRSLWATVPSVWNACATEAESAFFLWDEVSRKNITSLGDIPLIVLSSGKDMGFSADPEVNAYANEVFRTLQKEMAGESPNGRYLIAQNSSHYIQIDEPELVTGAIRSVVDEVRRSP